MLLFHKEVKNLVFSIAIIILLFSGCERNTPNEPVDDGLPPAAPRGLNVFREHDGEVGIEWNKNLETDMSHYKIFRTTISEDNFLLTDSTSSDFYFDYGLEYETTYVYKISAVDVIGLESEFSDTVSATPKNRYYPSPPRNIIINAKKWEDNLSISLSYNPSFSTDNSHYEIHKNTTQNFSPNSTTLIAEGDSLSFTDKTNLELLTKYYYRIISVDKGGLKSEPTNAVSDLILDSPKGVFPSNNSEVDYFSKFKIETVSVPAEYKIVLQSNEIYGTEIEINFSSSKTNEIISAPIRNVIFTPYVDYYWRVFTYTKSNNIPNSFSELYKFRIIPGGE